MSITVDLPSEVEKKLDDIAKGANLPLKTALEYLLHEYAENPGGAIYAGSWRSAKGMRYIVQWPFLSGFLKITEEKVVKRE